VKFNPQWDGDTMASTDPSTLELHSWPTPTPPRFLSRPPSTRGSATDAPSARNPVGNGIPWQAQWNEEQAADQHLESKWQSDQGVEQTGENQHMNADRPAQQQQG